MFSVTLYFFSRDFSLGGDYRYIVVKPNEVKYEILQYTDQTKDLSKSDWDVLKPKEAEVNAKSDENKETGSFCN